MPTVAVIGNVARDLVDGGAPRIGGGPFYAAQALRMLHVPSRVLTKSTAEDRKALVSDLTALGVPVEWRSAPATATFELVYDGDRRSVTIAEIGDTWRAEEVGEWVGDALGDAEWVHLAPLARSDFPAPTLAALADGRRLSFDGQGLVRPGRKGGVRLDADFDRDVLRHLQVLKLAEEEALVTLGPLGSLVFAGGPPVRVHAIPVDADPTGAGDMFMAAYVVARSEGAEPADAARSASRVVEQLLAERLDGRAQ